MKKHIWHSNRRAESVGAAAKDFKDHGSGLGIAVRGLLLRETWRKKADLMRTNDRLTLAILVVWLKIETNTGLSCKIKSISGQVEQERDEISLEKIIQRKDLALKMEIVFDRDDSK